VLDNKRGAVQYRLNINVENRKIIAEMIRAKILLLSTFCLFSLCFCALSVLGKEVTKENGVIPYKEWNDYTYTEKERLKNRWIEDESYKSIREMIVETKPIPDVALKSKGSDGIERYDLRGIDLLKADLQGAILWLANLEGADLEGAKYITSDQLCKTRTLYLAKLDSVLQEKVKKQCPELLVKPTFKLFNDSTKRK
jgi:hypothetical protein